MHWISPADELTHESYLRVLADGQFDMVLDAVGKALKVDSLVAYHLSFIAVSHSERGYSHHDTTETNGGIYNLIIPLLLEDEDDTPELLLWDDAEMEPKERGGYKYQVGVGVMLGDDAMHGTHECDYRNLRNAKHGGWVAAEEDEEAADQKKYDQDKQNTGEGGRSRRRIGMRLAATVYIGEIYKENVHQVAERTLTQVFPPKNERWLLAQEGRHWENPSLVGNGGKHTTSARTMANDIGRKAFRSFDELDDCERRAYEGLCESDIEGTRYKCTFSCQVFIEEGLPTRVEWMSDNNDDDDHESADLNICVRNRTGGEDCRIYRDDTHVSGDFISPSLEPGEIFPIVWRDDILKVTAPYAFQIGVPPELTVELLNYSNRIGLTNVMRELVGPSPIEAVDSGSAHEFRKLDDGNEWYVQRPSTKWRSNMHWISPSDERTHEEYLQVLARGNFDSVLDAIGTYLGLEGLVAYHLTFIGVSHSEKGYMHRDTHHTGGSVYNVIIPLILEDDASPELAMTDEDDETRYGTLKYRINTAVMMGDDAMHGTEACDYRKRNGMRLAATVYIADVSDSNAEQIASTTLTQIFPLSNPNWLLAEAGRHWTDRKDVRRRSLVNDYGRRPFSFEDKFPDCAERAAKGKCISDIEDTRKKCLRSCRVYELGYTNQEAATAFARVWTESVAGKYLDEFFESLTSDEEYCFDESDECEPNARNGMCLKDPVLMKEKGCNRSCLYCITPTSKGLYSLGVDQIIENNDDDGPSPTDVAEVIARTEFYIVNEVLVNETFSNHRLSCRNNEDMCSYWAAEGDCTSSLEYMAKNCPAACRNCLVDLNKLCPVDEDTNVFMPGDLNAMFERWLEEAGDDTSSYSKENLPTGGKLPVGELNVIVSPYHDASHLPKDEGEDETTMPQLPWVVTIKDFLNDEECDRLIELGEGNGYRRSRGYSKTRNLDGSPNFTESDGRTSFSTFCSEGCDDDPLVEGVVQRMIRLTGIPEQNYESLQLVRYEEGQFYKQHHDLNDGMWNEPGGPRILTIFIYLNDVEKGGGTEFQYLNYTAIPKRGTALIWPSVMDNMKEKEEWTWHEALAVEQGVKYGANAWIHLRDYSKCN